MAAARFATSFFLCPSLTVGSRNLRAIRYGPLTIPFEDRGELIGHASGIAGSGLERSPCKIPCFFGPGFKFFRHWKR